MAIEPTLLSTGNDTITANPEGIFNIVDSLNLVITEDTSFLYTEQLTFTGDSVELPVSDRNTFLQNWSIITIIFLLSLLASVRYSSGKYLIQLFQTFYKKGSISRLFREKVNNITHVSFRLDLLFYIAIGLLVYHFLNLLHAGIFGSELILYIACLGVVVFFMAFKFLLYRISGILFDSNAEVQEFIFYTKTGNRILGLLLLPIVILIFFSGGIYIKILISIGVLTTAIISIFNVFRGIAILSKKVFSIYYLILYLCSLEILPLLLVWKILWRIIE